MSRWSRGPITRNPYLRNAFRAARVPREIVRRRTLVHLISQTKRIVNTDPDLHAIRGEPVTQAEINQAEAIVLDPQKRILEELLVHAAETPPMKRIRQLAKQAAAAMTPGADGPSVAPDERSLGPWIPDLVRQYLDTAPPADPLFGAPELDVVPPFGREEGE